MLDVNEIKRMYPDGTRIVLDRMNDPWAPVSAGVKGTVDHVDDAGQIHMYWDNGRTLALVPGEDVFRRLTPEELEEEKATVVDVIQAATERSEKAFVNKSDVEKEMI